MLRVKWEQGGTEVRCWDCHAMVRVPIPRDDQQVAREFSIGVMSIIGETSLPVLLIVSTVLTGALVIPKVGVGVAGLFMVMGAAAYGDIIRRASEGPERADLGWRRVLLPHSPVEGLLCILMAAGTVVPLWVLHSGLHKSPHWDPVGLVIAGLSWTVVPIAFLMTRAVEGGSPIGPKAGIKILSRHPVATFMALALVPLTYLLIEASLGLFLYLCGALPFFALDFMFMPSGAMMYDGIPHYHTFDYRHYDQKTFIEGYRWSLQHGYTFVGSIPASLSNPTRAGMAAELLAGMYEYVYSGMRVFLSWLFLLCLISAIAIQARWLGSLTWIERKRLVR